MYVNNYKIGRPNTVSLPHTFVEETKTNFASVGNRPRGLLIKLSIQFFMSNSIHRKLGELDSTQNSVNNVQYTKKFLLTPVENARLRGTAWHLVSCILITRLHENQSHPHRLVCQFWTKNSFENWHACIKDTRLMRGLTLMYRRRQPECTELCRSKQCLAAPHEHSDTSDQKSEQIQNRIRSYVENTRLSRMRKRVSVQHFHISNSNVYWVTMFRL